MLKKIKKTLLKSKKILIAAHKNPDGDAMGTQLALYEALLNLGKEVSVVSQDSVPKIYQFLKYSSVIKNHIEFNEEYDVIITIDAANIDRFGELNDYIKQHKHFIINIDHHTSNDNYGDLNLVDSEASSVGEIVYELFCEMDVKITPSIAEALYTAIATDTGFFKYSNVSPRTFEIAGELKKIGIDISDIARKILYTVSFDTYKLLAKALETLKIDSSCGLVSMYVSSDMLKQTGTTLENADDFIDYLTCIEGIAVAVLFKEQKNNEIRVSLRSRSNFDVNKFANQFGGGGHAKAAGITYEGSLDACMKDVLGRLIAHG